MPRIENNNKQIHKWYVNNHNTNKLEKKMILWKEKELDMFNFSTMIFWTIKFIGKDRHLKQIRLHNNKSNKFLSIQLQFCIPLIVKIFLFFLF